MRKEPNGRAQIERRFIRPGAGWKHLAGSVWEHANGARVHTGGLVKFPNGTFLVSNKWPDCIEADRMVRINGGNIRRGLMAWAMSHYHLRSRQYDP